MVINTVDEDGWQQPALFRQIIIQSICPLNFIEFFKDFKQRFLKIANKTDNKQRVELLASIQYILDVTFINLNLIR